METRLSKTLKGQTLETKYNGTVHTYTLTEPDRCGVTSHRWATKDGKPHMHIMPSEGGFCNIFKYCGEYGYLSCGEILVPFEELSVEMIAW